MLRRSILILLAAIGLTFGGLAAFATAPVPASAASASAKDKDPSKKAVCDGIGAASGSDGCKSDVSLSGVLHSVINIFSVIIGIVAVIMIMFAGFKYITAAGDSGNITSAKHTLAYAIIGLVVAAFSQALVRFVLVKVSK